MVDKNKCVMSFLQTCPTIRDNPLFFNFGLMEDDSHQVVTTFNDVALHKPYIDGSVLKRYTIYIDSFKTATANPVISGVAVENIDDMADVQSVMDWVNAQGDAANFPNFGTSCLIESMKTLSENPELLGVNSDMSTPVAVYRMSIQIDYVDMSKKIWK